jgi:Zn-dependent protease
VDLAVIVVTVPLLLVSLTLHEVAHGVVADALGDPSARDAGRLTLNPLCHLDPLGTLVLVVTLASGMLLFGWAKPIPVDPRRFASERRGMMLVGAAGPLTNLLLACVSGLGVRVVEPLSATLATVFYAAFVLNTILALLNLLPVPPLDGSRIVGGLLPPSAYEVWKGLDRYGNYVLVGLLLVFVVRPGALQAYFMLPLRYASRILTGSEW